MPDLGKYGCKSGYQKLMHPVKQVAWCYKECEGGKERNSATMRCVTVKNKRKPKGAPKSPAPKALTKGTCPTGFKAVTHCVRPAAQKPSPKAKKVTKAKSPKGECAGTHEFVNWPSPRSGGRCLKRCVKDVQERNERTQLCRKIVEKKGKKASPAKKVPSLPSASSRTKAATTLQKNWRGHVVRDLFKTVKSKKSKSHSSKKASKPKSGSKKSNSGSLNADDLLNSKQSL